MVEAVVRDTMFEIGKDVLQERKQVASGLAVEKDNALERQDLLSVLVRSNLDEEHQRMTDEEVLARE